MRKILILSLIFLVSVKFASSQRWIDLNTNSNFNSKDFFKESDKFWDKQTDTKGKGWKVFKRWENFWKDRLLSDSIIPTGIQIFHEMQYFDDKYKDNLLGLSSNWQSMGPKVVPQNKLSYSSGGVGRINIIRFHPTNDSIIWVGSAGGGAWVSSDAGATWKIIDMTSFLSMGISDISISEKNPDVIYIATGDDDGAFLSRNYSIGIIKSIDGGKKWSLTGFSNKISNQYLITSIKIHPDNPDIVFAGTTDGIYKSIDGGANWEQLYHFGLIRDIEFKPGNNNILYATVSSSNRYGGNGKIIKSTDEGKTWEIVYTLENSNRIELSVCKSSPNLLYALASTKNTDGFLGLFYSNDEGKNWVQKSNKPNILSISSNGSDVYAQGFYDLALYINPDNPSEVLVGGVHIWKSIDTGTTWKLTTHWTGSNKLPYVHADIHEIVSDHQGVIYVATDGGIIRTNDNGNNWEDLSNGLIITQYYKLTSSQNDIGSVMGGAQDNGTSILKNNSWYQILGGDGMDCNFHPTDNRILYASTQSGEIYISQNSGESFSRILSPTLIQNEYAEWVTPLIVNHQNPNIIFVGYNNLFKSINKGFNWQKVTNFTQIYPIKYITIAPSDSNYVYFIKNTDLYLFKDNYAQLVYQAPKVISSIVMDEKNPEKLWLSFNGYDSKNKVYLYENQKSTNITNNLPNVPVNCIVKLRNTDNSLIIGTDVGAFIKDEDSQTWRTFNKNMNNVIVNDLDINYSSGMLYAATYGSGIWETKIFNCDSSKPKIDIVGNLIFCDGDSVTFIAPKGFQQYLWSNGSNTESITVKSSGEYFLNVKDTLGCRYNSDRITVNVNPIKDMRISVPDSTIICEGDSLRLTASLGFNKYFWSTGDTSTRIIVKKSGVYSVYGLMETGCSSKLAKVQIFVTPKPSKPVVSQYADRLKILGNYSKYEWYYNNELIVNSDTNEIELKESGMYFAKVFNDNLCVNISDTLDIIVGVNEKLINDKIQIIQSNNLLELRNFDDYTIDNIEIYDLLGNKLNQNINQNAQSIKISINDLTNGMYILKYNSNFKPNMYKFSINK